MNAVGERFNRGGEILPYGRPLIEDDDIAAVAEVLRSGSLTTGPAVARFEAALAEATGAPEAVVCANGTAALHLACLALDLKPDDTVIVPAITFVATANAARFVGAKVVFADVDPDTGLMRPSDLQAALDRLPDKSARAAFPVHFAGQVVDLAALYEIAKSHGMALVDDACHALGSIYADDKGRAVAVGAGLHSDLTAFSFHPVKTIAMGEGGALTLTDADRAARLRRLRSHGIERDAARFLDGALGLDPEGQANPWYQELQELGLNYRASDIHCALGASQLGKLGRFVAERRALLGAYDRALQPLAPHVRPLGRRPCQSPAWHLYVVLIDFDGLGTTRAEVMRALGARGIGSQVHYLPVPFQPYYRAPQAAAPVDAYPGAAAYYARCLSLPLFVGMTASQVDWIAATLAEILGL